MAVILVWAVFIAVGPGAALGQCGRKVAKGACKDGSFLACSGLNKGA